MNASNHQSSIPAVSDPLTEAPYPIDWTAVLNHQSNKRKYGPRTDGSSSRSSISSGLTERFSSSSSSSGNRSVYRAYQFDYSGEPVRNTTNEKASEKESPTGLIGKARRAWVKRRAKLLYRKLTLPLPKDTRAPIGRIQKEAAEELLRIALQERGGEDLVGRRLTKTALRQESVTRALFALADEEYNDTVDLESTYELVVGGRSKAIRLLRIVIEHSKGLTFFEESCPKALSDETSGSALALYLAATFPRFLELVNVSTISDYAIRLANSHRYQDIYWLRSIRLLDLLMIKVPGKNSDDRQFHAARTTIRSVVDGFAPPPELELRGTERWCPIHRLHLVVSLQAVITALQVGGGLANPELVLPSQNSMERFIKFLGRIIGQPSRFDTPVQKVERQLAMKITALLRDTLAWRLAFSDPDRVHEHFTRTCMELLLYGPQDSALVEELSSMGPLRIKYKRSRIEENAFDIFCRLPEPLFARALQSALETASPTLDRPASHGCSAFRVLEPLLWLSNMHIEIPEAHRALVEGGACRFLCKVIATPVSSDWKWSEREIWRAKGEAMTCYGNMIEQMDKSELLAHVTSETIQGIVAVKTSEAAPLAQRGQALYTLQRYMEVAEKNDVIPYYKEEIVRTSNPREERITVSLISLSTAIAAVAHVARIDNQ
ncbi:hypothetical protein FRB90_001184 [Tulasnella sp. 427]|nr:hypothetical protein FRB90_001184 [Tulasnella sp. 427]